MIFVIITFDMEKSKSVSQRTDLFNSQEYKRLKNYFADT